jgi:dGTPase
LGARGGRRRFPLDLASWPSLEAQIAAISDDIAYDNHDIDDGLRAGLFTLEDLLEVPFVARHWDAVRSRYPDLEEARLLPELIRDQIGRMVRDVLQETEQARRRSEGRHRRRRPRGRKTAGGLLGCRR